jgi:hypothetical protein
MEIEAMALGELLIRMARRVLQILEVAVVAQVTGYLVVPVEVVS